MSNTEVPLLDKPEPHYNKYLHLCLIFLSSLTFTCVIAFNIIIILQLDYYKHSLSNINNNNITEYIKELYMIVKNVCNQMPLVCNSTSNHTLYF